MKILQRANELKMSESNIDLLVKLSRSFDDPNNKPYTTKHELFKSLDFPLRLQFWDCLTIVRDENSFEKVRRIYSVFGSMVLECFGMQPVQDQVMKSKPDMTHFDAARLTPRP